MEEDIKIKNAMHVTAADLFNLKSIENRKKEYPDVKDQLDMLWHMMDDGTIPGKNSEWYNTIATIKNKYPKS